MESRFGRDFSRVRLHTDATAATSAEAVHARAYTVGTDVAFAAGQYAPATERGRELLAHELAHTIQQEPASGVLRQPAAGGHLEASADAAARDAIAGHRVSAALPTSGIGLACAPADDERAKAIAEAEAAGRMDDEPENAPAAKASAVPSRFSPGGFTDKESAAMLQEYESHNKLLSMALTLAERQARRREFWDGNPSYNSADLKEAFALDLYWDPKEDGYIRQPYVDKSEAIVFADPEARSLYSSRLWDLTENKEEKQSWFTRGVHWVCGHTEPCSSNIEQFRKDRESGMTRDEALNRGMARLVVTAETMALPTPGPSGPIALKPGSGPTSAPFTVPEGPMPLPEGATGGGTKTSAPPTPDPMLTTGSKSGGGGKPPAEVTADVGRVRELNQLEKEGKISGDVPGLRKRLRSSDPEVQAEAQNEFDDAKEKVRSGDKVEIEDYGDAPRRKPTAKEPERISTPEKSELENSDWLKKRLPSANDRRAFMDWLKKGHKEGELGAEIRKGGKETEGHEHLRPGSPEAETRVREWESEQGRPRK
jgi:hypothetical protein